MCITPLSPLSLRKSAGPPFSLSLKESAGPPFSLSLRERAGVRVDMLPASHFPPYSSFVHTCASILQRRKRSARE